MGIRVFILTLLATAMLCVRARAQDTQGMVPDPIVGSHLEVYASRLKLSREQMTAMTDLHATYASKYRDLRETDIQKLKDERFSIPLREFCRRQADLLKRIESLDGQLFDEMQPLLSDEQAIALPAVRNMRERERLAVDVRVFLTRRPSDLAVLIQRLQLDDAAKSAIESRLAQYDAAMTGVLRDLSGAADRQFDRRFKAWSDAGLPETGEVPAALKDLERSVTDAFRAEQSALMLEGQAKTRKLNRAACRDLCALLPVAAAQSLRSAFYGTDYNPNLKTGFENSTFDEVLNGREITPSQRDAVAAAVDEFNRNLDAAIEKWADEFDRYWTTYTVMQAASDEQARTEQRRIFAGSTEAFSEIREHAFAVVQSIIGEAGDDALRTVDDASGEIQLSVPRIARLTGVSFGGESDTFLPAPMTAAELTEAGQAFSLDAKAIEAVIEHYRERWKTMESDSLRAFREAAARLEAARRPTGSLAQPESETREMVEAMLAARRAQLRAIDEADGLAFEALRRTDASEAEQAKFRRLVDQRTRAKLNRGVYGGVWPRNGPGRRNDSMIDLSALVRRRMPAESQVEAVDRALAAYELSLTPILRRKFDNMLAWEEIRERDRIEKLSHMVNPPIEVRHMNSVHQMRSLAREETAAIVETNNAVRDLNDRTLTQLKALLPEAAFIRLHRDYERLTYPLIFDDPTAATMALAAALRLDGLPLEQRGQIEQLAAEYSTAYSDFCTRMMAAIEKPDSRRYNPDSTEDPEALQKREAIRLRLGFDRNELNVRTINRLGAILNPEQIKAIGGLPATSPTPILARADWGV